MTDQDVPAPRADKRTGNAALAIARELLALIPDEEIPIRNDPEYLKERAAWAKTFEKAGAPPA